MGPPGGGRNPVTPRFLRHFNLISFTDINQESLAVIFGSILGALLSQGFAEKLHFLQAPIVDATVEIYTSIQDSMLPTPAKSHYTFNLRDPAKVRQRLELRPSEQLRH